MYGEWYVVCDIVVLLVVEVCADYGGVNVFHVCLNFGVIYGVGVCVNVCGVVWVVVCCFFLTSGYCLLCCDFCVVVVYPLPLPLLVGGVRCSQVIMWVQLKR